MSGYDPIGDLEFPHCRCESCRLNRAAFRRRLEETRRWLDRVQPPSPGRASRDPAAWVMGPIGREIARREGTVP